jgi:hypothetical protein
MEVFIFTSVRITLTCRLGSSSSSRVYGGVPHPIQLTADSKHSPHDKSIEDRTLKCSLLDYPTKSASHVSYTSELPRNGTLTRNT